MTRSTPRTAAAGAAVILAAAALGVNALSAPSEASAAKLGQRTLTQGMRGKDVRVLQRHLNVLKLRTRVTAYFGGQTRKKVRRLERRRRWRVDGRVTRSEAKRIKGMVRKLRARKRSARIQAGAQVFPIPGPHSYGGASARFGAGRSGRSHQGQDVFAACGERLLSAQAGTVKARGYQGSGGGHYLVVAGADGHDYVYMHLLKASWAGQGTVVTRGGQIGRVGESGNASDCHLHFEMWAPPGWYTGGAPYDPYYLLLQWDSYS